MVCGRQGTACLSNVELFLFHIHYSVVLMVDCIPNVTDIKTVGRGGWSHSCPPDRSPLWTSSCTSCWISTGCFSLPASMTSRTWKISWIDLRWERSDGKTGAERSEWVECCLVLGSGEDRCLHEVWRIHEDARQQQDGRMGKQEGIAEESRTTYSQVQLNIQKLFKLFFSTFIGLRSE